MLVVIAALLCLAVGDDAGPVDDTADAAPMTTVEALVQDGLLDEAQARLVAVRGPFRLEDRVRREELFGVIAALAGDAVVAEQHFTTLLLIAPAHRFSYTRTPKVTFPYEKARRALTTTPALQVRIDAPPVLRWDEPIALGIAPIGNPRQLLRTLRVCVHLKGNDVDSRRCQQGAAVAGDVVVPAMPAPADGATGVAIVEVVGFDGGGDEVLRPAGLELPVGFAPPPPWWQSPWFLGPVSAVVVGGATAAVIAGAVAAAPTSTTFSVERTR